MKREASFEFVRRCNLAARLAVMVGLAFLLADGVRGPAHADDRLPNLSCTFESGASQSYENGAFKSRPSHPLSFRIRDIDLDGQTATLSLKPDEAGGKLSVVRAINANHFIEAVTEGFLNLTTVYDRDPETGKFPAVHSRHFGLLGQPVFGQYTGFCSPE